MDQRSDQAKRDEGMAQVVHVQVSSSDSSTEKKKKMKSQGTRLKKKVE
jgi:hypothetical protein